MEQKYATTESSDEEYVHVTENFEICDGCKKPTVCHPDQQINSDEQVSRRCAQSLFPIPLLTTQMYPVCCLNPFANTADCW